VKLESRTKRSVSCKKKQIGGIYMHANFCRTVTEKNQLNPLPSSLAVRNRPGGIEPTTASVITFFFSPDLGIEGNY
jgi:hypothetical protein